MLEMLETLDDGYRNYSKFTKTMAAVLCVTLFSRSYGMTVMSETFGDFTSVGTVAMNIAEDHFNSVVLHADTSGEHIISLKVEASHCVIADFENKIKLPKITMNSDLIEMEGACIGEGSMLISPATYSAKDAVKEAFENGSVTFNSPSAYLGTFSNKGFRMAWTKVLSEAKFIDNSEVTRTLSSLWIK